VNKKQPSKETKSKQKAKQTKSNKEKRTKSNQTNLHVHLSPCEEN
jgi:hypothetical protein